jgi:hypothetical protein
MSDIDSAALRLRELEADIARLEQKIRENPEDRSMLLNLSARKKLAIRMQDDWRKQMSLSMVDICDYRLIVENGDGYPASGISNSVGDYQLLFSQTFDALENGPKKRAQIGAETTFASTLYFGYTYSGSLGIKLLLKSERDFFEGRFDKTIDTFFELISINDEFEVRDLAKNLGSAVVKRLHDWASTNFKYSFDVDLSWQRSDGKTLGSRISRRDLERIESIIGISSDLDSSPVEIEGFLIGGDLQSRRFHFVVPNGESYRGNLSESFSPDVQLSLGQRYRAEMTAFQRIRYALNTEESWFELERLTPLA